MTARAAFHAAIAADPDSDTPRLVYADWLDEQGEGRRAAFIRCQCELARLSADDPRRAALRRLAGELFDGSWAPVGVGRRRWRRGFLWRWRCTDSELTAAFDLGVCGPMFETRLILPVYSTRTGCEVERVGAHPSLGSVARLRVFGSPSAGEFAALVGSPHLRRLESLAVGGAGVGLAGVRALCDPPSGFRLTRLALWSCFPLRDGAPYGAGQGAEEAVELIAAHPAFAGLESLALVQNHLTDAALQALLESPTLGRSLRLEVREAFWAVSAEMAAEFRRRFDPRSRFD